MHRSLVLVAALVLCLGRAPRVQGEVLPPERFSGYTLDYGIYWNGIPAARAQIKLTSTGLETPASSHQLELTSWTLPILSLIWPARNTIHATVGPDLTSRQFDIFRKERRKERSAHVTFDPEAGVIHIVRHKANGTVKKRSRPLEGLQGPVGMLYSLRQQSTARGATYSGKVVISDDVYRVDVTVIDRGTLKVGRRRVPVVCLNPVAVKVRDNGEERPLDKVRWARIWVTDDALRVPIRLQAGSFIGRVTMALRGSTPPLEELYADLDAQGPMVAEADAQRAGASG